MSIKVTLNGMLIESFQYKTHLKLSFLTLRLHQVIIKGREKHVHVDNTEE